MANRNLKKEVQEIGKRIALASGMVEKIRAGRMNPLTWYGVEESSIEKLEELIVLTTDANTRREHLENDLGRTTDSVYTCARYMDKKYSEIREKIKATVTEYEWKEFSRDDFM
jgi:hypothetical protein